MSYRNLCRRYSSLLVLTAMLAIGTLVQAAEVKSKWLGVSCRPVDDVLKSQLNIEHGLLVHHLFADAPAAKGGVKKFDILLQVGDQKMTVLPDLLQAVREGDDKLAVTILRGGKEKKLELTPNTRPANIAISTSSVNIHDALKGLHEKHPHILIDGQLRPHDARIVLPGVEMSKHIHLQTAAMPEGLQITMQKTGAEPAKLTIKKGDKTWKVTEKELNKLPEDIRPHARRVLGGGAFNIKTATLRAAPVQGRAIAPVQKRAQVRVLRGANAPAPFGPQQQLQKQLKEMQKQLEELKKGLDELRETEKK